MVSSTPLQHFTPGKDPVPILQEAGWAPGPVWTGGKSRPHRDSIPDLPARSQSLYRLSYPAHNNNNNIKVTVNLDIELVQDIKEIQSQILHHHCVTITIAQIWTTDTKISKTSDHQQIIQRIFRFEIWMFVGFVTPKCHQMTTSLWSFYLHTFPK